MGKVRFLLLIFILVCIFGFGIFLGKILPRQADSPPPQIVNSATIIRQVQTLSELITVKYVMERVVQLDDVKWYGENRVVLVAHGIVKAGIDFSKVQPEDIAVTEKSIRFKLPLPLITDVYFDDKQTRVIERSTGIMRTFDKDLEQTARKQALEDLRRIARQSGILKDAEDRARTQLTNLFTQMGFSKVEIESPYDSK